MREALVPQKQGLAAPSAKTFSAAISALGTVWTSGCTAARFDAASKRMVVEGDLVEQAGIALNKVRTALEAGALGLGNVTAVVQFVAPAGLSQIENLRPFYAEAFSGRVPLINTVVVKRLLREAALIEIEAIARLTAEPALEYLPATSGVDLDDGRERVERLLTDRGLGWSDVAAVTEFLRAGHAPAMRTTARHEQGLQIVMPRVADANAGAQIDICVRRSARVLVMSAYGEPAAGGVLEQCREIYADLGRRLQEASSGLDAVVKTTEFVTPEALAAYRGTADIRRQVFAPPFPAATGVVCEGLGKPHSQIAVEVIAVSTPT